MGKRTAQRGVALRTARASDAGAGARSTAGAGGVRAGDRPGSAIEGRRGSGIDLEERGGSCQRL